MFHAADRVIIAIMNNHRDFQIARDEGWYRIPVEHAPESIQEADIIAFYFTRAFGEDKWSVRWYAPVRGYELVHRTDLLPEEDDHPRADNVYYKVQLGPLQELERPIPSLRWRRIVFIETSWDRFISAHEINDLYASGADGLYVTLKEAGFHPEREFLFREGKTEYMVELAIPCQEGTVTITVDERPAPPDALIEPDVDAVRRAVKKMGGLCPPDQDR